MTAPPTRKKAFLYLSMILPREGNGRDEIFSVHRISLTPATMELLAQLVGSVKWTRQQMPVEVSWDEVQAAASGHMDDST
jgi:hypothetical protein